MGKVTAGPYYSLETKTGSEISNYSWGTLRVVNLQNKTGEIFEIRFEESDALASIVDSYGIDECNRSCCVNCAISDCT